MPPPPLLSAISALSRQDLRVIKHNYFGNGEREILRRERLSVITYNTMNRLFVLLVCMRCSGVCRAGCVYSVLPYASGLLCSEWGFYCRFVVFFYLFITDFHTLHVCTLVLYVPIYRELAMDCLFFFAPYKLKSNKSSQLIEKKVAKTICLWFKFLGHNPFCFGRSREVVEPLWAFYFCNFWDGVPPLPVCSESV